MKLSQLVAYRNALDRFTVASVRDQSVLELQKIVFETTMRPSKFDDVSAAMQSDIDEIKLSFDRFDHDLQRLKKAINTEIEHVGQQYFAESYRMYEQEMIHEPVQWVLDRRMPLSQEAETLLLARLQGNSDWRYPAMIIRPSTESFIEHLVSFDPLYILDHDHDLLRPAMQRFPQNYQQRIRPYVISERDSDQVLGKIPDGQFGLCLVYNFFNYKPFEIIRRYLQEIFIKLRPGGVLYMTINDCDRAHCVALCEAHFTCYTPGGMIRDLAESMGFRYHFAWTDGGNLSWVELKKPGELTSLRGGQTLAKIIEKPIAKSK